MEYINEYIKDFLQFTGLTGNNLQLATFILMIIVIGVVAWLSGWICRTTLIPLIQKVTQRTKNVWDEVILSEKVLKTACRIVPAVIIAKSLPLVFFQYPILREALERLTGIYITIMGVLLVISIIKASIEIPTSQNATTRQYFRTFCGVLQVVAVFIAVIISVAILFDKNPMSLLAGLGATSAVMMLIFKDTIEGLVAGIRLTSNNMVRKGDWITVPSTVADGEVVDISLTTVKIKNFDNTMVTVSPTTLVNGSFQNWRTMQQSAGRRVQRKLFIDFRSITKVGETLRQRLIEKGYFTAEEIKEDVTNIALFRWAIEKHLAKRSEVNTDMTYMARQLEATPTGLPINVYFFLRNKEWVHYEHTLADIMENVFSMVNDFDLKIFQQYTVD